MSVNIESEARYVIVNKKAGTVIDLSGTDGHSVTGWERHDGTNQQWETIQVDENRWHIKNVGNGKYLSLGGQSPHDDVRLVGSDSEYNWELLRDDQDGNGIRIKVPDSWHNVDLTNHGDSNPGTPIAIWGRWEGQNQVWYFERV